MTKYDPHAHEPSFRNWKERGRPLEGLTDANAALLRRFIEDMEIGANVNPASKRGPRSYGRLRNLKSKLHTLAMILQERLHMNSWDDLLEKELELLLLVKDMREGQVVARKNAGKPLRAIGTYVKVLKSFWHWYQRSSRKLGRELKDVTIDLDARDDKPKFNYFTINDLRKLCDAAKHEYRILMMFLFDTGIRAPTELMNVRVSDLEWSDKGEHYTLSIREEASKTFGRRIKLLLCSDILREYIKNEHLGPDHYLFRRVPHRVNQYLKVLGHRVLGVGAYSEQTYNGRTYPVVKDGITMYDFRHSSACYWLPRYKSESALKYRFGWKKSDMIHYYTELMGMHDTIQEEDLYVDVSKTELERQISEKGKEIDLLQEQLRSQDQKMERIMDIMKALKLEKRHLQQIQT